MKKQEIIDALKENHSAFTTYILSLDEHDFLFTANGKWTPGQQAEHILRSVKPVSLAFSLPLLTLRIFFGKANRPSRNYTALVQRYFEKLSAGGKASGRFIPKEVAYAQKEKICSEINATANSICKKITKYSEAELDNYILPHPLFGKITLREMLYFTIYHVQHHQNNIKELLKK